MPGRRDEAHSYGRIAGASNREPRGEREGSIGLARNRRFTPTNRYGVVIGLIAATYVVTASAHGTSAQSIIILVQLLTVWIIFGVSESPRAQRIAAWAAIAVVGIVIVGWIVGSIAGEENILRGLFVISTVLYLVAPVLIVRNIAERDVVDGQTVLGSIAAYLLLGMMFAFLYRAISAIQSVPPFFGTHGRGSPSDDLFFSFITLTTTGYGNLVPAANPGQTVAVVEAIVGQLFLVTAVAKVVSAWRTPRERRDERP